MLKIKKINKSIVYKISIRLMSIIIIFLSVLILSNVYLLRMITNNLLASTQNTMMIYLNIINNSLNSITKDLNELSVEYIKEGYNTDDLGKYLYTIRLQNILTNKMLTNNNIDGIFISIPKDNLIIIQFSERVVLFDKLSLDDYLKDKRNQKNNTKNWSIIKINNNFYLVKKYDISGTIISALVKVDTLMSFIRKTSLKNKAKYAITDKHGNILSVSDRNLISNRFISIPNNKSVINNYDNKYFIVSLDISTFSGKLSSIIDDTNIFSGIELIQWIIIALSILSILIIPYFIHYLFHGIIRPIKELVTAAKEIENGNWDHKLPSEGIHLEFIILNKSIESMVNEIKTLKINYYEEKIERQKTELKYLQMQLKPHFYLNALSTIASLTYQNKNEEIRTFVNLLSKHLRYMFRGIFIKVTIDEEIEHVRNYIKIQEIKFPNNIFYMIEVDSNIKDCLIPQLLIHTFVENIFKHAFAINQMLSIFIKVEKYTYKDENYVRIAIEDNGDGFKPDILEIINKPINEQNNSKEIKIGIINIKKTLYLLYKRSDLLKFSNCEPNGAMVEILIPIERGEQNESVNS